ncbi:MAG TPA: hypothetical protein VMU53_18530 [Candidatus Sulfotelmatobacter sp.]|nr:hypothetical protein [Candidatus Sulfotelmatobacter sp.]
MRGRITAILLCGGFLSAGVCIAAGQKGDTGKHKDLRWAPPNVETPLASVQSIPPCDEGKVLQQAGARAVELTTNLENFTAEERIDYQRLDRDGVPEEGDSSVFDYVFAFEKVGAGRVSREYRNPARGGHAFPASGQDTGEVALPLIFLPSMQTDYQIKCEGLDKWQGQLAWVMHFRQREDKPARTLQFRVIKGTYFAKLAGRAWIAMDRGQIIHLETNTMEAIPSINIQSGATSIDYAPVQIQSKKLELWLPERIEAYWEIADKRLILYHTFSDFKVFSVDTEQNIQKPKDQ